MAESVFDEEEFERWRAEAEEALRSARVQAGEGISNWACFSAEQAAQLAVKGLLHGLGRGPSGHDLPRLAAMLEAAGIELPAQIGDAARRLGRHYIPARYPDAHGAGTAAEHYGPADAEEAIAASEALLEFVDRTWEEVRRA
jgi:HEPN domain-containing protein